MGRTLSNTMLNLSLQSAVDEALYQASLVILTLQLFIIVNQSPDGCYIFVTCLVASDVTSSSNET